MKKPMKTYGLTMIFYEGWKPSVLLRKMKQLLCLLKVQTQILNGIHPDYLFSQFHHCFKVVVSSATQRNKKTQKRKNKSVYLTV